MRKVTRTQFEEEDDDMVRETVLKVYIYTDVCRTKRQTAR